MKKIEILSPVGEKKSFYRAIKNGADAVYFGLSKFNARLKADNISLDDLKPLVEYAHLKNVKVYLTLNTLVTTSEMDEVVSLVRACVDAGVDAYIVQDYGIVGVLKRKFPGIVLHGSTQLGVHNVYGARVAKALGLSRVVLSREVTIPDIEKIRREVDIELEVFVQGAMCVSFSGNCYLSSLKCGASGNRGECKQLCRLPYTMYEDAEDLGDSKHSENLSLSKHTDSLNFSIHEDDLRAKCNNASTNVKTKHQLFDGNKSVDGYMLSPRDNCMLCYLDKLVALGVESLKIEGRLKRDGYVATTTRVYREALDRILSSKRVNMPSTSDTQTQSTLQCKSQESSQHDRQVQCDVETLKRVFSRGEFVAGYNDGKDIIDTVAHDHLGEKIGKVVYNKPFKDMYVLGLSISTELHSGDGLKFVANGKEWRTTVNNIMVSGKNIELIVKNKVDVGAIIFRSMDSMLENTDCDYSSYFDVDIFVSASVGEPISITLMAGDFGVSASGGMCETAKVKALSIDDIRSQVSRLDLLKDFLKIRNIGISMPDNLFVPLSVINGVRREALEKLKAEILSARKPGACVDDEFNLKDFCRLGNARSCSFSRLQVVDEDADLLGLTNIDAVILSPKEYSLAVIQKFYERCISVFPRMILNLPTVAFESDMLEIKNIIDFCKEKNIIVIANNIFEIAFARDLEVWAGTGLNVTNLYAVSVLSALGVKEFVASIEKWVGSIPNTYGYSGNLALMTFVHCPYITLSRNSCASCSFSGKLKLRGSIGNFAIRRYKIKNCYFELVDEKPVMSASKNVILDFRG